MFDCVEDKNNMFKHWILYLNLKKRRYELNLTHDFRVLKV